MGGIEKWPGGNVTSDWYSIAGVLTEMEANLGRSLAIRITSAGSVEHPDLLVEVSGSTPLDADAELAPWVSVRSLASKSMLKSLMGVITFLLYQSDFANIVQDYRDAIKG